MTYRWIALVAFVATSLGSVTGSAQALLDRVSRVGGEEVLDVDTAWISAADCANTSGVELEITLDRADIPNPGFLWLGDTGSTACELNSNRLDETVVCVEVSGDFTPGTGNEDNLIRVPLKALEDTGLLECDNTLAAGQVKRLFVFRSDPGSTDNTVHGIAAFTVDVTAPASLDLGDTALMQSASSFGIGWANPSDTSIDRFQYTVTYDDCAGGAGATTMTFSAGNMDASSVSITAAGIGLELGDSATVTIEAIDEAGNVGQPSAGVCVERVATTGFCADGNCGDGCALSPGNPGTPAFGVGLLAIGIVVLQRRKRSS